MFRDNIHEKKSIDFDGGIKSQSATVEGRGIGALLNESIWHYVALSWRYMIAKSNSANYKHQRPKLELWSAIEDRN